MMRLVLRTLLELRAGLFVFPKEPALLAKCLETMTLLAHKPHDTKNAA